MAPRRRRTRGGRGLGLAGRRPRYKRRGARSRVLSGRRGWGGRWHPVTASGWEAERPPAPGPACDRAPRPASPPGVLSAVSWLGSLGNMARQRWLNGVTGSSLGEKVQRFLKGAQGSSWMGFLGDLVVKNPPASAGDPRNLGSVPWPERCPGEGNGRMATVSL